MMPNQSNQIHEDVHKKFIDSDIKRWKEEIDIIEVEMTFYRNLLNAHIKENEAWDIVDYSGLAQGISDVQGYNVMFQTTFLNYSNRLQGMAECEDLHCENYYLNEHTHLKESIEGHFSAYKQFKKTLFTYFKLPIENQT